MNKKAKSMGAFAFLMCLVVVVGMFVYYRYMNRQKQEQAEKLPTTEVEKLLAKDMEQGYPETPKEVIELYCRINQCLYKGKASEEDFDTLLEKMRMMYAKDFLENNLFERQKQNLKKEIKAFSNEKKVILSFTVASSGGKYKKVKDRTCTVIQVAFFLREKEDYTKVYEEFMLTKEDNQWKILGFRRLKESEAETVIKNDDGNQSGGKNE